MPPGQAGSLGERIQGVRGRSRRRENDLGGLAEVVAAIQALIIVEDTGIDHFTELGAGDPAGRTTDQAANQRAGQGTEGKAEGTSNDTKSATDFGTAQGAGDAAGGAANTADDPTSALGTVMGLDIEGITTGATEGHQDSFRRCQPWPAEMARQDRNAPNGAFHPGLIQVICGRKNLESQVFRNTSTGKMLIWDR